MTTTKCATRSAARGSPQALIDACEEPRAGARTGVTKRVTARSPEPNRADYAAVQEAVAAPPSRRGRGCP